MITRKLPAHVAIIMDGNGRWAKQRFLPRASGHRAGLAAVRQMIDYAVEQGIEVLTLFAFSRENWSRPPEEVSFLMGLFHQTLERELQRLMEKNIQLRIIGDMGRFDEALLKKIKQAQEKTAKNQGLKLVLAIHYGGQWDICQAMQQIAARVKENVLQPEEITPALIESHLSLADLPPPDLFIRTSGEQRISNFLLWQLAYSELYFTDIYWPDFNAKEFERALDFFRNRERRFGFISEQLAEKTC